MACQERECEAQDGERRRVRGRGKRRETEIDRETESATRMARLRTKQASVSLTNDGNPITLIRSLISVIGSGYFVDAVEQEQFGLVVFPTLFLLFKDALEPWGSLSLSVLEFSFVWFY